MCKPGLVIFLCLFAQLHLPTGVSCSAPGSCSITHCLGSFPLLLGWFGSWEALVGEEGRQRKSSCMPCPSSGSFSPCVQSSWWLFPSTASWPQLWCCRLSGRKVSCLLCCQSLDAFSFPLFPSILLICFTTLFSVKTWSLIVRTLTNTDSWLRAHLLSYPRC